MDQKSVFSELLKQRKPVLAYNPPGLLDPSLAVAVSNAGGIGLIDCERLSVAKCQQLLNNSQQAIAGIWGVRVTNDEQLALVLNLSGESIPKIIVIATNFNLTKDIVEEIVSRDIVLLAEVISLKEAYAKRWADSYLVKGYEAAGTIGEETSYILAQQFANAGLPFMIQGGIGFYSAPAVFSIGAQAIVLDTQLYITPESPLSAEIKEFLSKLDATDTKVLGKTINKRYRVYARLGTKSVREFLEKEKQILTNSAKEERIFQFNQELLAHEKMFANKNIANSLIPVGQDIPFAKILTDKFSTVKGIIAGLLSQVKQQFTRVQKESPFQENGLENLDNKYPIIQGPMANVSESPAFADAVSSEGALPFLALGSLFPNQTRTLIEKTKKRLGSRPFGVGLIGLEANRTAFENHLTIIKKLHPPYAVVAAGTIVQAKEVKSYGIKTFLHTPSPLLFREAIESDLSHLVLEGMECGGHIGVLTSFVLWELALHQLEQLRPELTAAGRKITVAFAGGICDRFSAAMVGVFASYLPEVLEGVMWIGSAYILTKEIVDTETIKPLYQQLALNADKTMVLGETVNTRARSIPTPFAKEIVKRELKRLKKGMSLKERKHKYERDNLGATRIAALGEIWNPDGEDDKPNRFMPIDEEGQYQKGNYLIGQVVANLRSIRTIHDLHKELIYDSVKVLKNQSSSFLQRLDEIEQFLTSYPPQKSSKDSQESQSVDLFVSPESFSGEGVAIVGLGGVFPDAQDIPTFWQNILNGVNSIKEIPAERWSKDINLFYHPDPSVPDKSYTKIAATIADLKFNPIEFKIPPKLAQSIDPVQKMALMAAKEALEDANLLDDSVDHSRTAVIVGNSMGGEIRIAHTRRIYIPEFLKTIEQTPSFSKVKDSLWSKIRRELEEDYSNRLMDITEDSMPGELSNIIAGRIANTFNLRGKNMTCDAACASSLAALNIAVKGLLDNEYDIILCGGADRSLDPPTFVKFSKIGALSATGSYPFDERASGFVMGEGAGFCILKRLSDAIRDNDKIYAVIRGMGASSDGKGKGITAPNPLGQQLAIDRALQQAGVDLSALQYIEAHGTSTRVGDVVEMDVLNNLAKDSNVTSIALGSVKSQIGHLKSAAGIASLIKTALAIYHKTIPPSINFERPNPKVDWSSTPFFVNTQTKEWTKPETGLRMAGVSAFGFGGTNYHVILEEYVPGETKGHMPRIVSPAEIEKLMSTIKQAASYSTHTLQKELVLNKDAWQEYIQSNLVLEMEPIFLGANSPEELLKTIQILQENIPKSSYLSDGQGLRLRDFAQDLHGSLSNKYRIAIPCKSFTDLSKALELAEDGLKDKAKRRLLRNKGLFYSEDYQVNKIAFLFPGQGSQYVGMLHKLWKKFEIIRATFREADKITKEHLGRELSKIIFADGVDDSRAADLLRKTELTQPAMFIADIALFRLLTSFGIKPDVVAGHSLGEYAALVAAGILSFEDGLLAVIARGKAMAQLGSDDLGMMASIGADYKTTEEVLEQIDGYVIPANKNCNKQTVIAGETEAVAEAIKAFSAREITVIPLPVSAAFHTKLVAPAVEELKKTLEQLTYNKPSIPISSNVTGKFYPETKKEIISLLCQQVTSTVEWITQMEEFYENEGVTTFIEVGPKRALTSFAKNIFEGKAPEILALAANHPKKGEMQHFYEVIAALGAYNYPLELPEKNAPLYTTEFLNPLKQFYQEKHIPQKDPFPQTSLVDPLKDSPFAPLAQGKIKSHIKEPEFQKYLELQAPAISAFLEAGYQTYKDSIASALKSQELVEKMEMNMEAIGVTGVSIGLPGRNRKVFAESNFDAILSGENFIEPIPMEFREKMVEKNIVRLVKDAVKGAQFQSINDVSEVIKLAAQKGEFDLAEEYGVDAGFAEILDATFQLAFAAGIEALRDAGIPLMPLQVNTSVGKKITRGWALPEPLRDETGIVFASAFPAYSNLISTVSDFLSAKFANKNRETIHSLFEELISQISDKSSRKKMEQWFADNFELMTEEQESKYQFSRKFLFEVLSMGHSQFAQFIRARGPNTQVNAACSSTTQAISIAEDWIRNGRCKRVIVVAADDVTNEQMLDWIGAGFLAVGAATTKEKVEEAALPFDKRRHGMIIGMGAVGIVLESESAMNERGVKPIVDLLGTHIVNSAYHGTRLDRNHIATQVNNFIEKIEKRFNVPREKMAKQMVFVSHETYTPARGGSASAEVDALRNAFGEMTDKIVIANTKGFTGHAMGAGIEDAVAIKILEKGIVPPVANWEEFDPELGHLNLSKGGKYDVKYALRFAAGFGSQLTLALFRLNTKGGRFEGIGYDNWLNSLGGSRSSLEVENKTLRMKEDPTVKKQQEQLPLKTRPRAKVASNQIVKAITDLIIEKTGYPPDMVEPDMHLEEDLGIDTVKQAELFGVLRTKYDLPREEGVRIQDLYSVNKIAQYVTSRISPTEQPSASQPASPTPVTNTHGSFEEIRDQITDLIIEKTGYPRDMVEPDMHLEEDLGIDTVKQAELFGKLRTQYDLPREEGVRIQDFYSVNKIAQYVTSKISPTKQTPVSHSTPAAGSSQASQISLEEITKEVIDLIIEKTGYPRDMVEPDMELEEDLGIDTVKQAEMFGIIRNKWNLPREEGISIQDYSTANKIAKYIQNKITASSQAPSKAVAPTARTTQDDYVPSRRFTIELIDAPMPKTVKLKLTDKKFIVVGEENSFTTEIITLLEKKKVKIVKFLDLQVHNSRDKILAEIPDEVIDGLVYIEPKTTEKNKHDLTARIFFTLCRDINYSDSPLILSVNKSTTAFGWTGTNNPISGSITGLTKAVARELPNGKVKCVSCVDPKLAIAELCAGDGSIEIAYTKKGKRKVFAAIESPIEVTEQPFTINKDELVVITGGALGITYQVTRELAKRYQPKLALIGIEKLPENIDEIANYNEEQLDQLKEQLISDLKQKHDRITPVLVEKEWSKITKAIDIRKAIEELTSIGCVAKYYSADVVNSELMQSTFEQIKSDFNQDIIGLIHGAGLEISKLIKDKKPQEFDLVYNVKSIGLDNLLKNTDQDKLQFLVCFSSVAGRFGNGGQVDYAAANDYLSKNCWQLSKKGIRAKAICWSAWAGVGMATRGSIMKVLQQAGVTPIQIEDGVKAFMDELEFGQQPEVVVAGKLGVLLESPGPAVTIDRRVYPLVGKIKRNFDGSIVAEKTFSVEENLFLNDHRFDDTPFYPGVMGLELFAELAKVAFPRRTIKKFEDVKFRSAIKFIKDEPRTLKAIISNDKKKPTVVLESQFIKDGVKLGDPTLHFAASLVFGRKKKKVEPVPELGKQKVADIQDIYKILPHGPLFQVLDEINRIDNEIVALGHFKENQQFSFKYKGFTTTPLVIESAFQTMGLFDIIKDSQMGLPFAIKSLSFYKNSEAPAIIRGYKKGETEFGSVFDFEILTKSGELVLQASDYSTAKVDFGGNFQEVETLRLNRVKQLFDIPKKAKLEAVSIHQLKEQLKQNPSFLETFLHPDELAKYQTFKIEKRQDEWLAGVLAAKKALTKLDPSLEPQSIKIEKSELGEPFILLSDSKKPLNLSITHSNGYAIAIVSTSEKIGIDLETITKRDPSFIEEVLAPQEKDLLNKHKEEITEDLITKIWSAKEAASKVLGVGLNVDLHDIAIIDIKKDKMKIQIDPRKLPKSVKVPKKAVSKDKSAVGLMVTVAQNEESVAAVCQYSES